MLSNSIASSKISNKAQNLGEYLKHQTGRTQRLREELQNQPPLSRGDYHEGELFWFELEGSKVTRLELIISACAFQTEVMRSRQM